MKIQDPTILTSTRQHWQSRYAEPLTEEDARTIAANITDFFGVLADWESENPQKTKEASNYAE